MRTKIRLRTLLGLGVEDDEAAEEPTEEMPPLRAMMMMMGPEWKRLMKESI